eukprot:454387_1
MAPFRQHILNLFRIKSNKNLKQVKIECEKHNPHTQEYQYKITISFCKKIKTDPNRYMNKLYAEIMEKPYLVAIQRGFNLSLYPELFTLKTKFKPITKMHNSPKNKRTNRSPHNKVTNNSKKRRHTYNQQPNYSPKQNRNKQKHTKRSNRHRYTDTDCDYVTKHKSERCSNINTNPEKNHRKQSRRHTDTNHIYKTHKNDNYTTNRDNKYNKTKRQNRYENGEMQHTHKHNDNIQNLKGVTNINKKRSNANTLKQNKNNKKRSNANTLKQNKKGITNIIINNKPWEDPTWSPPPPSCEPPTIENGAVVYHDDVKKQNHKNDNNNIEMIKLQKPNNKNNNNNIEIIGLQKPKSSTLKKSKSDPFVLINSIRIKVTAYNPDRNPADGLLGFWVVIGIVIICCLFLISAVDGYIADIYINMHNEGTYIWSLGWRSKTFKLLHNASCKACVFDSNDKINYLIPIPNTTIYMKNAGYLLITSVGIILICIVYILRILCERRNRHEPLYIKINCLNIKIPQRATVYVAWNIINCLICSCIIFYIMLFIYSYFETSFYLYDICPSGLVCNCYVAPNYGFIALLFIFCVTLFGVCCTKRLDPKLNMKHLDLYFPDHLIKSKLDTCNIKLEQLCSAANIVKNIFILTFVLTKLKDVGMINTVFYNETESVFPRHLFYSQFHGLTNSNGLRNNSYLNVLNSDYYNEYMFGVKNETNITSGEDAININEEISSVFIITSIWDWWIWIVMITNVIIIAPYIWYVILKFSSHKQMKSIIIGITFFQWLGHFILIVMYYVSYSDWFNNHSKDMEFELHEVTGFVFDIYWLPDFGIFFAILLWYYQLKLMYFISKAM